MYSQIEVSVRSIANQFKRITENMRKENMQKKKKDASDVSRSFCSAGWENVFVEDKLLTM